MTRLYIAGPMRGIADFNFPAFHAAAAALRRAGYAVLNPAELDGHNTSQPWAHYMRRDLITICTVIDALALLPGWEESEGACLELHVATSLGMEALPLAGWLNKGMEEPIMPEPLPADAAARKTYPLYRGLFRYFPRALAAVAHHSYIGNEQHHPGEPLHWDRRKSTDEEDALLRHVLEGEWVAVAWRALAKLEKTLEAEAHPDATNANAPHE